MPFSAPATLSHYGRKEPGSQAAPVLSLKTTKSACWSRSVHVHKATAMASSSRPLQESDATYIHGRG